MRVFRVDALDPPTWVNPAPLTARPARHGARKRFTQLHLVCSPQVHLLIDALCMPKRSASGRLLCTLPLFDTRG